MNGKIKKEISVVMALVMMMNLAAESFGQIIRLDTAESQKQNQYISKELAERMTREKEAELGIPPYTEALRKEIEAELREEQSKDLAATGGKVSGEEINEETIRLYYEIMKEEAKINGAEEEEVKNKLIRMPSGYDGSAGNIRGILERTEKESKEVCMGIWEGEGAKKKEVEYCYERVNWMRGALGALVYGIEKDMKKGLDAESIMSRVSVMLELVEEGGIADRDRASAVEYLRYILKGGEKRCDNDFYKEDIMKGLGEKNGKKHDIAMAKARRGEECGYMGEAMIVLGIIATSGQKDSNAELVYKIMRKGYDYDYGAILIQSGVAALIAFDTVGSYDKLDKFLKEDLAPHVGVWKNIKKGFGEILDLITIEGWANKGIEAINKTRGGGGRYLNGISERYQYLDEEEARKQGFAYEEIGKERDNTYITMGSMEASKKSKGTLAYNLPFGNVLEDIGVMISTTGTENGNNIARKILEEYVKLEDNKINCLKKSQVGMLLGSLTPSTRAISIAAGSEILGECNASARMNIPVVSGILRSGIKGEAANKAAKYINNLDWWDLNEGTQRRINNIVVGKGYSGVEKKEYNSAKDKRYRENSKIKEASFWTDMLIMAISTGFLVISLPNMLRSVMTFSRDISRIRNIRSAGKAGLLKRVRAHYKTLGVDNSKLRAIKYRLESLKNEKNRALKMLEELREHSVAVSTEKHAKAAGKVASTTKKYEEAQNSLRNATGAISGRNAQGARASGSGTNARETAARGTSTQTPGSGTKAGGAATKPSTNPIPKDGSGVSMTDGERIANANAAQNGMTGSGTTSKGTRTPVKVVDEVNPTSAASTGAGDVTETTLQTSAGKTPEAIKKELLPENIFKPTDPKNGTGTANVGKSLANRTIAEAEEGISRSFRRRLLTPEIILEIIDEPLVPAMLNLSNKNVETLMSGLYRDQGIVTIAINYDLLSDANKIVANKLVENGLAIFQGKNPKSPFNDIYISLEAKPTDLIADVSKRMEDIVSNFKIQDVPSKYIHDDIAGFFGELYGDVPKEYFKNGVWDIEKINDGIENYVIKDGKLYEDIYYYNQHLKYLQTLKP